MFEEMLAMARAEDRRREARSSLVSREAVLGRCHPDTLASWNNLGHAYQEAGRVAEAIALFEQALAAGTRALGPAHPTTVSSRVNLAGAYRDAGL